MIRNVFILISISLFLFSCDVIKREKVYMNKGVLDLSSYKLDEKDVKVLLGDLEFYYKEFIPVDREPISENLDSYLQVISSWSEKGFPALSFGSYRFTILVPDPLQRLAIKIPDISSAYKIYINGKLYGAVGTPGKNVSDEIPKYDSKIYSFIPESESVEFIIHISNFNFYDSGISEPIYIGSYQAIDRYSEIMLSLQMLILGGLLIVGLYHLFVFMFFNKMKAPIYLSIFCLLMALRVALMQDRFLSTLFDSISYTTSIKIFHIDFYMFVPIMLLYIKSMFTNKTADKIYKLVIYISIIFIIIRIVFPVTHLSFLIPIYQIITLLSQTTIVFSIMVAVKQKQEEAKILLVSLSIISIFVINDILNISGIITTIEVGPFGVLFLVFSQALLLSKRYARTFYEKLNLNKQLNSLNQELEQRISIAVSELKLKNIVLETLVITDGLTHLFNHKYITKCIEDRILESKRYSKIFSIIMFDIDHFKNVNDTYGHTVGDVVLEKIGSTITKSLRNIDIAGRYGGEEFLIFCPETTRREAFLVAERLRIAIMNIDFKEFDEAVTISGGIAEYNNNESGKELIHRADLKLYTSKKSGRNKICI